MPSVATIQDVKSRALLRADDELEELIERSLHTIRSKRFELSIYFGCNVAERHADLSRAIFNLFPVPLMRASFSKSSTTGKWRPSSITPIPVGDLPASHASFVREVIAEPFARRGPAGRSGRSVKYEHDLAILANDEERSPPSNREALNASNVRREAKASTSHSWAGRLRPDRGVRRFVHPRDDEAQPSHVQVREPGARRGPRRDRRPRVDHPLRQQGVSLRARQAARPCDPADDGREQRAHRRDRPRR